MSKQWGGKRPGAGRPRKYRYLKMEWNSKANEYVGILPDGTEIHVDADVYAEQQQAGVSEQEQPGWGVHPHREKVSEALRATAWRERKEHVQNNLSILS